ncbi:MAG: DMT family transporter [Rhodospirillaceae bacterium]
MKHGPGIAFVLLGYLAASACDSAIKWASGRYPVAEELVLTALFSLIPLALALAMSGGWAVLATRKLPWHLLRGGFSLASSFAGYYALGHMPLADFYALIFTAPLIITALSAPLAGERVDLARWLAVLAGFVGVVVMVRPGSGLAGFGALGALGAALFYALAVLLVRRMGESEPAVAFGVYGSVVMIAGSAAVALARPDLTLPALADLPVFAFAGIAMGCAMLGLFGAFRRTPAAVLAPFQYSQMIWGTLIGFTVFGEQPDAAVLAGGALVVGAGLYVLRRERRPGATA